MLTINNKHEYFWKGEKVPGVTTILGVINKPALVAWSRNEALKLVSEELNRYIGQQLSIDEVVIQRIIEAGKKQPDKIAKEAADMGTKAHKAISQFLKTGTWDGVDVVGCETAVESFKEWFRFNPFKVIHSEILCYSPVYNFAGTIDIVGQGEAGIFLGDWKTTKSGVYTEHAMQVAAYWHLLMSEKRIAAKDGYVFWLDKTGISFKAYRVKSLEESFNAFLGAYRTYLGIKTEALEEVRTTLSGLTTSI